MDEFYGGYNYTSNCDGTTVSAADNIINVNEDDVILIDGLTKRFRLPGWVMKSQTVLGAPAKHPPACRLDHWTQSLHQRHRFLRLLP